MSHRQVPRPWLGVSVANLYTANLEKLEELTRTFPHVVKGAIIEQVRFFCMSWYGKYIMFDSETIQDIAYSFISFDYYALMLTKNTNLVILLKPYARLH